MTGLKTGGWVDRERLKGILGYIAFPALLLVLDIALRWHTLLESAGIGTAVYALSIALSALIYRGVEGLLHDLRHAGRSGWYGLGLALAATLYGANLLSSYAYFTANRSLPDLFTLSYIRWETAHSIVMARDSFHAVQAVALGLAILLVAWVLHRTTARTRRSWDMGWRGKSLHLLVAGGCFTICVAQAAEQAQCFLPDVNTPTLCGRFLWKEFRGQNAPPIRLKPRTPMALLEPGQAHYPTPPVNILLILNESLRRQELSLFGYARETTPQLKRFAQAHPAGFFPFPKAFSNSSATLISVPSILTGISPLQPAAHLSQAPLLWEWGKAAGMRTFFVSSQDMSWCGMDRFMNTPSPDVFWDKQRSRQPYFRDWGIDDRFTVDEGIRQMEACARTGQRFMGVIHLNTNHYPYNTHPEFERWTKDERDRYDNTVLELDSHMGRILKALADQGRLEDTAVIFTSDHGEAFEEHGYIAHFYCHYVETISVPMWMYLPQSALRDRDRAAMIANQRVPVQNLDLMPTLLDLMGLWGQKRLEKQQAALEGSSLLRPITADRNLMATNTNEVLDSAVGLSLIRGRMHYLLRTSTRPPQEDLYNLETDPWERRNAWKRCPDPARRAYHLAFKGYPSAEAIIEKAFPKPKG